MPAAQSQSLIHQYSAVYTQLQEGKRELIGFGIDRVLLNRYIADSAESTSSTDPEPVIATVSLERVTEGKTRDEKTTFCRTQLSSLIGLQEEVNTLQKVARESGIGAGLLTIVGQASVQSPGDNGASVIHQLNQLLNGDEKSSEGGVSTKFTVTGSDSAASDSVVPLSDESAANDSAALEFERLSVLQKVTATIFEHKSAIGVDVLICFLASCLAIKLVV